MGKRGYEMKAELNKDGYVVVTAETIAEGWALNITCPEGAGECGMCNTFPPKVVIDCSILLKDEDK